MSRFPAILAVSYASVMWGLVPVGTRWLLADAPPHALLVLRLVPTGILAAVLVTVIGVRPIAPWAWARILIAALAGNVSYQTLVHYGIETTPAIWSGMLFGLEPVFVALFAIILASERLTTPLAAGMAVAFGGTALLVLSSATGLTQEATLGGLLMVAVSTMGWGIYTVVLRPAALAYGAFETTCLTLGISALPMVFFMTPDLPAIIASFSTRQWAVVAALILFATFGAILAWNYGSVRLPSTVAGPFLYLQPVSAAVGGVLVLGERITAPLVAGGALIMAGVAIAQFNFAPKSTNLQR